jgi:predicted deacylase
VPLRLGGAASAPHSRGRGGGTGRLIERRTIRFDTQALGEQELPCFEAVGASEGPHLCLLAGIHGGEYSSIAAVVRFMNELDTEALSGRITAVPVVSMTSFQARTPFVVPEDGKNLNRCFPGSADGTFAEVLAHHVFTELIAPSDALIDLHGGDMVEALEPFVIYSESAVAERARGLAFSFGFPYVVRMRRETAPIGGTTADAAADAGIPAVVAEAGGCGLLEESAVRLHLEGLQGALAYLGMLPAGTAPVPRGQHVVDRFLWLRSDNEGWWEPVVRTGDVVASGARLGTVKNLFGDVLEDVVAPEDGVVLFLTSSPAVAADGLLLGLGAGLEAVS